MSREMDNLDDDLDPDEAILKKRGFNPTLVGLKDAAGQTMSGGFLGALAGGTFGAAGMVALAYLGIAALGPFAIPAAAAGILSGVATPLATAALASAATTGALWGAGIGATVKGVMAVSNMNDTIEVAKGDALEADERRKIKIRRLKDLRQQRDAMAVATQQDTDAIRNPNPNQALPRGRVDAGVGVNA